MIDARLDSRASDSAEHRLREAMASRVLVLDGAIGTMLLGQTAVQPTDALSAQEPRRVLDLHRAYLAAGADIITTNTFQGIALGEAAEAARERNTLSARLARRAVDETLASVNGRPFVAGAMGPPPPRPGDRQPDAWSGLVRAGYAEQAEALLAGGVDLFLVETILTTEAAEAAVHGIRDALSRTGQRRPILLSVTLGDRAGTTACGRSLASTMDDLLRLEPFSLGVNCSFGLLGLVSAVKRLSELPVRCVSCHPSAGLPDPCGRYPDGPDATATQLGALADAGLLNIAGGCCGTTPGHVHAIAAAVRGLPPRRPRN